MIGAAQDYPEPFDKLRANPEPVEGEQIPQPLGWGCVEGFIQEGL